jgi:hypothetical protein
MIDGVGKDLSDDESASTLGCVAARRFLTAIEIGAQPRVFDNLAQGIMKPI